MLVSEGRRATDTAFETEQQHRQDEHLDQRDRSFALPDQIDQVRRCLRYRLFAPRASASFTLSDGTSHSAPSGVTMRIVSAPPPAPGAAIDGASNRSSQP